MKNIMEFDCPILDINDSKMGKVGLVILVDMSTNMVPTESNKHLKLTRKILKCWKQPSIYAWPIENSGLCKREQKRCSIDTLLSYGLLLVHALVAYPSCAMCGKHFEWCGAGQTLASSLMARAMYHTYVCPLDARVTR
jgi:hypothetical protein